jgi:hypothetical protein
MKMFSQNWLYLEKGLRMMMGKGLGMMMKLRSVALYRMLKILVWFG